MMYTVYTMQHTVYNIPNGNMPKVICCLRGQSSENNGWPI